MNEKLLGEMPLATWRWLGVNNVKTKADFEEEIITVADNEVKKISDVNVSADETARKIKINVGKSARVEFAAVDLGHGNFSADVEINLDGDDSTAEINSVYFGDGKRKLNFNYVIRQRGLRTNAVMNVRGALNDECNKIFRGTLDFQRGAKGSIGRELEEVIILSDTVRNRSVPLMLSNEDDVDGHHAVSVGRLDEEKIFYLMSRGLDKVEAEKLIVEAAFNPVLEKISDESLRAKILDELNRRLVNSK